MPHNYNTRSRTRRNSRRNHSPSRSTSTNERRNRSPRSDRHHGNSRNIREVFQEFREVFDPDSSDRLSLHAGSSFEERDDNLATPEWARTLIENQRKALDENIKQLNELKMEVRSLKRKRDEQDGDKSFEWKKRGNRKQYKFNCTVEEQLEEIATSKTLLEARTLAEKGLSMISERNKLIKIADKYGWDTVNAYVSDPLAKDDADDKRLRKAVKDAEKSREKSKREKEAKARRSNRARYLSNNTASPLAASNRLGPPNANNNDRIVIPTVDRKFSQPKCYRCGKTGHLMRDCLTYDTASNSKS